MKITASEGHRAFGKLLKRVHDTGDHLVVERDGYPVAVLLSYQEYKKLSRTEAKSAPPTDLPPVMTLDEAFGSVSPINRPEDFKALREAAIEDHLEDSAQEQTG